MASVESLLRAAGWTVAELSRRAHMDHSAVARLLRGDLSPGNRSIAGLLHAFSEKFPKIGFYDLFELGADSDAPPLSAVEDSAEPEDASEVVTAGEAATA